MKVIYIAGPYRAKTPHQVEQNIRVAEAAMLEIASLGAVALCPHTMTRHLDGTMTDEYWLEATMELMRRCDAVYLVAGWARSTGTLGELEEARRLGIPRFDSLEEVSLFVEEETAS